MIRHVVVFRWKTDTAPEAVEAVRAALVGLPAQIPAIRRYEHGVDAGLAEGNFDYAVVADFDDRDAFVEYRDHPRHRAVITELIAPHIAERVAVQYEL